MMADEQCSCMHKKRPRSGELQKTLQNRLNRISGQIDGMKKMIDDNRYCGDILIQLAAVESALSSLGYVILQNHMETCVVEKVKDGDTEVMDELLDLMRKLK